MMLARRSLLGMLAAAAVTLAAGGATNAVRAQRAGRGNPAGRAARAAQQEERKQPPEKVDDRSALQRQVRQAFNQAVRRRLNLNDEQMRNLQRVNRKYDEQRRDLLRSERSSRQGLAATMRDTTIADQARQAKISQYMDELVQSNRRRADLLENEQKDLAGFMTPMQRAQFSAMRDRFNRRVQELDQDSTAAAPGRRGGPPPGPPAAP
jgi:hypothetical protein